MDVYRSGHNGPDSKSGSPHGLVGSNPTASVPSKPEEFSLPVLFLILYIDISELID